MTESERREESAGLKQEAVAAHFGVAVSTVSAWENGHPPTRKTKFPADDVDGYADLTHTDRAWLYGVASDS